jgi:Protein of unknown function (DUF4230)
MSLLSPERSPAARGSRVGGAATAVLATGAIVAVLVIAVAAWLFGLVPGLESPFGQRSVDRSPPAVLRSLADLHEYRAATGHFETIVDLEHDTKYVPRLISGDRTLFVAVGNVDAGVDFSGLDARALDVSRDRRSVTVTLPHARLLEPHVDAARSHVVDRRRGLIDRVESVFQDSPTGERELYLLAQRKLAAAARDPASGLAPAAERNTRDILTRLLGGLGFERVTVRFR